MKTSLPLLVSLLLLGVLGYLFYKPVMQKTEYLLAWSYCDEPIHYKEGSVDPRFKISQQTFLTDIQQAESLWDKAYGKQLFVYDPKTQLSVNLVYDDRQALDNQLNQIQDQVDSQKNNLNPQIEQYKADVAAFRQKLADLNSKISYWNQKGGAPPDIYTQLISEQASLQAQANQLNQTAKSLNQSTEAYNSEVDKLQTVAQSFSQVVQQKPEEGVYDPEHNRIEIYYDNNQNELIHTLAHELGHARGLNHDSGSLSIMYPYTTASVTVSPQDLAELQQVCRVQGPIEWLRNQVYQLIEKYNSQRTS